MSGGFLGIIPPYFFLTASSYKIHALNESQKEEEILDMV